MFVLQFSKVEKASTEQVDAAHKQYMAALASLYLKHNTDENVSLVITWSILSPTLLISLPLTWYGFHRNMQMSLSNIQEW